MYGKVDTQKTKERTLTLNSRFSFTQDPSPGSPAILR